MKHDDEEWRELNQIAFVASVNALTEHCWGVLRAFEIDEPEPEGLSTLKEIYVCLASLEKEIFDNER